MARLVVVKGAAAGAQLELPAYPCVLGRGSGCDRVIDDRRASRQHACIRVREGVWAVRDLETANGTYVDGARIDDWTPLTPGCRVRLGHTVLRFEDDEPVPPPQGAAPALSIPGHEVFERVGVGASGAVYRARQVRLDRIVAIKVLDPALAQRGDNVEKFEREARAAAALSHLHVVPVYDVGSHDGVHWFSMEYMAGGTVEDRLLSANGSRLPWREAVALASGAAKGLAYLHAQGFAHRDVKPANLLLDARGRVKLGDMGTVVRVDEAVASRVGTPHFMSPEQARRAPVTRASDVYSLGATLYRMLSGETPHHGDDIRAIVESVAHDVPPPIEGLCPGLRPEVVEVVHEMMAREPSQRPADAAEVGRRLDAALADIRTAREETRQARRRRSAVSEWAIRLLVLGVIALALYLLRAQVLRGARDILDSGCAVGPVPRRRGAASGEARGRLGPPRNGTEGVTPGRNRAGPTPLLA